MVDDENVIFIVSIDGGVTNDIIGDMNNCKLSGSTWWIVELIVFYATNQL